MQILLVRLSSMGDLLHSLPALTDAARALPNAAFDWLTDQAFADIPRWHAKIRSVIPVPSRALVGGKMWSAVRKGHYSEFARVLRGRRYDLIIDLQGEWKSAVAARYAKGPVAGYDSNAIHEWGAQFFYHRKFFVPKDEHSIRRMRSLLASALGYSLPETMSYGIDKARLPAVKKFAEKPYLVFIHSTSWESKCWPEDYWRDLASAAIRNGFSVVLPWGTEPERKRALRIARRRHEVVVLPKMSISEKARVIAEAGGTVGLDTGLSHIAAALGVPSLTLYGATDPALIGATGENQAHVTSTFECLRCHRAVCSYGGKTSLTPACLAALTADQVWSEFSRLSPAARKA